MRLVSLLSSVVVIAVVGCAPAKTAEDECRRQNAARRLGRMSAPNPQADALDDLRCDEVGREERAVAREEARRAEDRAERAQARREMLAAVQPSQSSVPNLRGLWIGDYGYEQPETIRVHQDGAQVYAIKVTGDPHVPAGKPTFRASLADGLGDGHIADEGYERPRWVPGRLSVLAPDVIEFIWSGAAVVRFRRVAN